MLSGDKNLKDPERKPSASYGAGSQDMSVTVSYTKTNKLITALYMVTDIMDKEEPIRNKLRTLGTEIISDPEGKPLASYGAGMSITRIEQVISFLNIASAMNFISEMNCSILKKEFLELKGSIEEHVYIKPTWLEEFLSKSPLLNEEGVGGGNSDPLSNLPLGRGRGSFTTSPFGHSSSIRMRELNSKGHSNGHQLRTRIGVQKGSTLLKALSDIKDTHKNNPTPYEVTDFRSGFEILKKERRDEIINIIKDNQGSATITDIRTKINAEIHKVLVSCSEKTLQRELISMTKDGVLNKTGEKRWSRYVLK